MFCQRTYYSVAGLAGTAFMTPVKTRGGVHIEVGSGERRKLKDNNREKGKFSFTLNTTLLN